MNLEVFCKKEWKPYFIKGKRYSYNYMASTFYERLITNEQKHDIILSRIEFEYYFTFKDHCDFCGNPLKYEEGSFYCNNKNCGNKGIEIEL